MWTFARPSIAALVLATSAFGFSAPALAAPPRSFPLATKKLGPDTVVVVSANGKSARATQLFGKLFARAMQARDLKDGIDLVKKTCKLDPITAVDDVTVGVDEKDRGTVFVALAGVSEAKLTSCITAVTKKESGKDLKVTKKGDIIELDDGSEKRHIAWLPGDIIAFTIEDGDRAKLEKAIGGGFSKSTVAARAGRLQTDATVFGAWTKPLSRSGMTLKAGDFAIVTSGGKVSARVTAVTESSASAAKVATALSALGSFFPPKSAPKEVHAIARSLKVTTSGADVTAEAAGTDAEVIALVEWLTTREKEPTRAPTRR